MNSDSQSSGDLAAGDTLPGSSASGDRASTEAAVRAFGSPDLPGVPRSDAHILVVDDEPINVKVVQKFLLAGGYQRFSSASSGQQALELAGREMPDIVLLDIFLGDINGIEVLKRLRTLPGGTQLPVLILTASDDPDLKRCALDLGAVGFITKPIHQTELVAWMQKSLCGS